MFLSCLMQKAKKEWTIGIHLLHRIRIQMTVTYVPLALKIIYTNIILSGSHLFSCTVESLIKVPWVPPSLNEFRGKCFSYYSSSSMVPPNKNLFTQKVKEIGQVAGKYTIQTKYKAQTNGLILRSPAPSRHEVVAGCG